MPITPPPGRSTDPRAATISTTAGSAAVTAASGVLVRSDIGRAVTGAGIPAGATLTALPSTTAGTLSAAATATGTATVTLGAAAPSSLGFVGWSPETDAESQTWILSGVNAGSTPPGHPDQRARG